VSHIWVTLKAIFLSQFIQEVSLLTVSNVPVVDSIIQLVKQMIDFYPLKNALEAVEQHILKGESLSKSLSQHNFFDNKMIALVKVAEEINQTEITLIASTCNSITKCNNNLKCYQPLWNLL
tara:strand:- start:594 stop:956 length:363 start_codon:yes stop_codon:yes gene_type:complete